MNIIHGDMREVVAAMRDAGLRVDAVVTDPPYHLTSVVQRFGSPRAAPARSGKTGVFERASRGFKGKAWDGGDIAFRVETWQLIRSIMKPGAHMVAFGGTRTFHRMAVAIEDAGFSIRDTLAWLYGCLDAATECLTAGGWKRYSDLTTADLVMQWDAATGSLSWVHPSEVMVYPYSGEMVRLVNRHIDQMLTPNHRVYARLRKHSRDGAPTAYEVVEAGDLRRCWQITLPMAGNLIGGKAVDPDMAYLAGWWMTDAYPHGDGKAVMFSQSKPETMARLKAALAPHGFSEYVRAPKNKRHAPEHTFYVLGPIAAWLRNNFPDRRLGWNVLGWSEAARARLLDGLMDGDGSRRGGQSACAFWSRSQERRDVFMALALSLGHRAYDDAKNGCVHFNIGTSTTQIQAVHRVVAEPYEGNVWCVRVPTGAFVVRRNGRPFITGNSGFPKARRPADGWATALKPAWEPILLARAPLALTVDRTFAEHGTGALNIEECRIPTAESLGGGAYSGGQRQGGGDATGALGAGARRLDPEEFEQPSGRWPANVVHDGSEEVEAAFAAFGEKASGTGAVKRATGAGYSPNALGKESRAAGTKMVSYGDTGSASRFFYSAKATAADRAGSKHPTVKPIALMRWLVRMVTPPGGLVLDPFAGSGTTGAAALAEGKRALLIENEAEYIADIRRRLAALPDAARAPK